MTLKYCDKRIQETFLLKVSKCWETNKDDEHGTRKHVNERDVTGLLSLPCHKHQLWPLFYDFLIAYTIVSDISMPSWCYRAY